MPHSAVYSTEVLDGIFVVTVRGDLSLEICTEIIWKHYPTLEQSRIIWNLSSASFDKIDVGGFRTIAETTNSALPDQRPRRTAYVSNDPTLHHLMCVYTAIASMSAEQIDRSVFHTFPEAVTWCNSHA